MAVVKATAARKELFKLIRKALRTHQPVHIQHREGQVVLLAEEEYEGLLETLELLSIPGFRESLAEAEADIAAGRTSSIDAVFGGGAD
ncbi:type II toxin-antitoxin system Phd/YefM family antitoxin [Acidobacteria bacterium AH-259-G07]|nr:type II toxin-antitoxin system Phd/YefM family antitoxin [Acidobacteria bacterium AH-259-L09]MDA2928209.1 type II toxin-antitoxin system Phd/YefM family antitoxin [Acidobacteria bacterium AH-259-G07]